MRAVPVATVSLALTIAAGGAPCAAQEAALGLDEAMAIAARQAPSVAAAAATAEAAAADLDGARARRMPSVDVSETYQGTDSPAETFALLLNQERFDMQSFFAGDPNDASWLDTFVSRVEVTQPVYTGGALSARIDQARRGADAATLGLERARQNAAFGAAEAFVDLARAREQVEVLVVARDTTIAHRDLARDFAGEGLLMTADVLRAEVYLAEVEEELAVAREGAAVAEAALNFRLGAPQPTARTIETEPRPAPVDLPLEAWIAAALERRPDLRAAREQLEAARLEERVAKAALRPEVGVVGRYDLYDDVPFGANGNSGALIVNGRWNVFDGGADRAAVDAARLRAVAGEAELDRAEEGVRLEIRGAWQRLEAARQRQAAAATAVEAADEVLRTTRDRFEEGLARSVEVLEAETDLRQARLREVVARYDRALATYRLHHVAGTTMAAADGGDGGVR